MNTSLTVILLCFALSFHTTAAQRPPNGEIADLPRTIFSGNQGKHHVQGIAVDLDHGHIYFSFTTRLLKTDLRGTPIGSVEGLTGHLGCLTLNPDNGNVYGSLEYKNDAIGKGIDAQQAADRRSRFYIAVFDCQKITRLNMDAERDSVMSTIFLKTPTDDYYDTVQNRGKRVEHRFGCSGIDGVTFAPQFGKQKRGKHYLMVAYGIYGEIDRTDNDYQVILAYDTKHWSRYEQPLSQNNLHTKGPKRPAHTYFLRTGNTTYGIQNLAYDRHTGNCYAAVYKGRKEAFPNYSLFVIDGSQKARRTKLQGFDTPVHGNVLQLLEQGHCDKASGIWGWHFPWGATGLCSLGGGYFYISHPGVSANKEQNSTLRLYRWTGENDPPFEPVE